MTVSYNPCSFYCPIGLEELAQVLGCGGKGKVPHKIMPGACSREQRRALSRGLPHGISTPYRRGAMASDRPAAQGERVPDRVSVCKYWVPSHRVRLRAYPLWPSPPMVTARSACQPGRRPSGTAAAPWLAALSRSVSLSALPRGCHPRYACRSWWYSGPHARAPSGPSGYPWSGGTALWQTCAAACAGAHP
jgi:hypothetical protein